MKRIAAAAFSALCWAAGSVSALAAPDVAGRLDTASSLLTCMRANLPPTVRVETIELTTVDRSDARRTLKGTLYAMRENGLLRAMIHIDAPSDLAGASYLFRETGDGQQIYMYLPALNRVRRITGSGANGALFGTDLSYADVRQLENAFSGADARLQGDTTLDGRTVARLSLAPRAGESSRYDRIRVWVDRHTCVALKVEFEVGGKVVKRLRAPASALRQSGGYWYVDRAQMTDLGTGSRTELRVLGVRNGGTLPHRLFDPHAFYLGGGM